MIIKPATRQGVIPLISLYSESGCGKTYSSLLLARGLAGPTGKIVMVDTESRRGSLYADVLLGGYDVLDLDAPFAPARYIEALQAAFDAKPACVVVDSMSHEWEGIGGVCDMAAENEDRSKKSGLHNWKQPKFEHAKLVQFILRSPVPLICCIRAKYKTRQKTGTPEMAESGAIRRDQVGKTIIIKDEVTSPIQAEDFIFESTCHAEILPDHSINLTKCSHPSLRTCFPEKGPIEIKHGEMLAQWCQAPGKAPASASAATAVSATSDPLKLFRERLWATCKPFRGAEKSWVQAEAQMIEWNILQPGERVSGFTTQDQFIDAIDKVSISLSQPA